MSKMARQNNKELQKTNKQLKCGKAHLLPSISPLQELKCLLFSLIRWPQQGAPCRQPRDGEPGLGLWRVLTLQTDSKSICIRLHMRVVVGISFDRGDQRVCAFFSVWSYITTFLWLKTTDECADADLIHDAFRRSFPGPFGHGTNFRWKNSIMAL